MASRSGHGAGGNRQQQRSRDGRDDFPPLPLSRLPSLRALSAEQEREQRERDRDRSSSASPSHPRIETRFWSAAARRAERIRNLDSRIPSLDDLEQNSMDASWYSSSRRPSRLRPVDSNRRANLEELDQTLDEANSQLRNLLDMTNHINLMTPLMRSSFSPSIRAHDFPDDNLRSKRRKLDSNKLVPSFKGFRYGKYGQVEPGHLQMEIVSCDGGMFSNESSYAAENILKNDNSVYCTKGNRCNIVLRHQGATIFTLAELVIKAPASMNYSHPVREGMVFIAMNQDDVLSRTAQYQIQYVPNPARDKPWHVQFEDRQPFQRDTPRHIVSIRHHDDGTTSTRVRRSHYYHREDDESEHRMPDMPQEFAHNQPDLRVTTECSDDEEDSYDMHRILRRAPNRIGSLPFETETSDSEDANPFGSDDFTESFHRQIHGAGGGGGVGAGSAANMRSQGHNQQHQTSHSLHQYPNQPNVSLSEAWDAHANATQEAVRAVGGELLVPHARFYIEKKKSKCTIRFDPPVSGRFILLKMWSSHHDPCSNIDIQSVIARGYAGPRYFPSVQLS